MPLLQCDLKITCPKRCHVTMFVETAPKNFDDSKCQPIQRWHNASRDPFSCPYRLQFLPEENNLRPFPVAHALIMRWILPLGLDAISEDLHH
eukprot:5080965-Amphidinium_carterae.1